MIDDLASRFADWCESGRWWRRILFVFALPLIAPGILIFIAQLLWHWLIGGTKRLQDKGIIP